MTAGTTPPSRREFLATHAAALGALSAWPPGARPLWEAIAGRGHVATEWDVAPSFGFDALCFLNTLTGDPFYVRFYPDEYEFFGRKLTPGGHSALASLWQQIKASRHDIISTFLCMQFSAGNTSTLSDLIASLDDLASLEAAMKNTAYYRRASWQLFVQLRPDLRVIFQNLRTVGFEEYWQQNVLPVIEARIQEVAARLGRYDVVGQDEAVLGQVMPSRRLTANLLYFSDPHGFRVTGQRFACRASWSFRELVSAAVHELLHPPFDLARDADVRNGIALLRGDPFVMDKVNHHNISIGYNSVEALVEEDCVRALEQLVMERLKLELDARKRWQQEDDGIHVFAAALYALMGAERFPRDGEPFREFLARMFRAGRLAPGQVAALYQVVYPGS